MSKEVNYAELRRWMKTFICGLYVLCKLYFILKEKGNGNIATILDYVQLPSIQ